MGLERYARGLGSWIETKTPDTRTGGDHQPTSQQRLEHIDGNRRRPELPREDAYPDELVLGEDYHHTLSEEALREASLESATKEVGELEDELDERIPEDYLAPIDGAEFQGL